MLHSHFVRLVHVDIRRCTSMRVQCAFGFKRFLACLLFVLEALLASSVNLISKSNKFHARYMCVKYDLHEVGARFRHASVRYRRVSILRDIASVTYAKRV